MFFVVLNTGSGNGANVIRFAKLTGFAKRLLVAIKLMPMVKRAPPSYRCQHGISDFLRWINDA